MREPETPKPIFRQQKQIAEKQHTAWGKLRQIRQVFEASHHVFLIQMLDELLEKQKEGKRTN